MKINIYKILFVCLIALYSLHHSSCANTQGAPTGGPKDSIPPVVLYTVPDSNATNVARDLKSSISITFDEYIQIRNEAQNILLSPPQKKRVKTKIRGKSLIINFEEPLDSNKSYTLYFGSAIVDNNEGNILPNYAYSFSTGPYLDSLLYSGTALDYEKLSPMEGVTVALYENPADSAVLTTLPDAVTRSDKWGYFCFRNLKSTNYTIFAFKDENNNNLYDPGIEPIGFLDSTIVPTVVMDSTKTQIARYLMDDTLHCMARPIECSIYLFKEKNRTQYIRDYKRISNKGGYIKFGAADAVIDSFSIFGIKDDLIIKQFNALNDSLLFWINDPRTLPDTLLLGIKYLKTDSLGNLAPAVEELKLVHPLEAKKKEAEKTRNDVRREDLLNFDLESDAKMVEQTGYVFTFTEPLVECNVDSIVLTMTTPRQVVTKEEFTFTQDSLEINKYYLKPVAPFAVGNEYELYLPYATFKDINGFTNDSTRTKLTLPTADNLSSLTLDVKNVNTRYIIDLVNDTRSRLFRQYIITSDTKLLFPYLDKGKYSVRITEDKNNNGLLDPGILLDKVQPEKVRLYKMVGNSTVIQIEEKMDLEQEIDINALFTDSIASEVEPDAETITEAAEETQTELGAEEIYSESQTIEQGQ